MAFQFYNRHPKGIRTGDCVVRAISTAYDSDYNEERKELNQMKRDLGLTSYKDTDFLYKYLKTKKAERIIIKQEKGKDRMKGSDFCELYPKGIFILKMLKHFSVCVNGVILDTWDCSYRSVYTAWEVKRNG